MNGKGRNNIYLLMASIKSYNNKLRSNRPSDFKIIEYNGTSNVYDKRTWGEIWKIWLNIYEMFSLQNFNQTNQWVSTTGTSKTSRLSATVLRGPWRTRRRGRCGCKERSRHMINATVGSSHKAATVQLHWHKNRRHLVRVFGVHFQRGDTSRSLICA